MLPDNTASRPQHISAGCVYVMNPAVLRSGD